MKHVCNSSNPVVRKAMNADACVVSNFNYKNKYQWFVVTPSMSGACILAGNEYREDAQEVFKEIKGEEGIPCKVVARRTLERAGIDPNAAESWAKGIRKATANACDVATNENLPYMVVIDFPTRREVLSPLFSSEWAATSYAKRMAGKINEKVRVIHKPDGNIVWENACGTVKNADDGRTRFRREVEKIYKAAGEAMAISEDLLYAATYGEYEDYSLARSSARTLKDLAGKLYSFALKARS